MLDDRPYLRTATYRPPRSLTITVLIVNAVVFVAQCVAYGYPPRFPADGWFALNLSEQFHHFQLWQLLTYQFLHGGLLHLLLNCWAIYLFGREVEEAIGKKSFLLLYLCSGLVGGLLQLGAAVVAPQYFGVLPVVGASACAFGLVAVFATLYPERPLTVLLFFVLPVTIRAKYLLLFSAILALFGIAFPADHIAHAAHLGGILTGMAFVKYVLRGLNAEVVWPAVSPKQPPQSTVTFVTVKPPVQKSAVPAESAELAPAEFIRRQVDPILDKISAHGIQSLTAQERRVLEQARQRMDED